MIKKMPPELRGHRFFNFRIIFSNHFAFIRSFADLLVSFALLLVSFALLLVSFALLLVNFALLLVNSVGISTLFMIMKGIYFKDIDSQSGFVSGSTLFLSIISMDFILFISPLRTTATLLLLILLKQVW
ncbi:hypothetical protein CN563_03205 [Bacillus sp. AFS026049]|nr:hypothetical protein CN563_03205 [Bacillus sp. AFS026049]